MPAQQERRESPAVQQDHRLLAAFEPFADRLQKTSREDRLLSFGRVLFAHVDDLHFRQRPILNAAGQVNVLELLRFGISKRFHRRRRRTEDDRGAKPLRAHDRRIARVVARRLFLLVGRFVLLIDDDEPQICAAARRPRSASQRLPARARAGYAATRRCAACASASCAARRHDPGNRSANRSVKLRRQSDFGNQDEARLPAGKCVLRRLNVDLGLAAAGDAVQQDRAKTLRPSQWHRAPSVDRS